MTGIAGETGGGATAMGGGGGGANAGVAGCAAPPNPPRAQSTTLDCANLPQMSSAPGGGGAAAGLDHSDAGFIGAGVGTPQLEAGPVSLGGVAAPHPETDCAGATGVAAAELAGPQPPGLADGSGGAVLPQPEIGAAAGGGAMGGSTAGGPHPLAAGDAAAVGGAAVGGAAQFCDIGPVPEMADPTGRASQLPLDAGGAAASVEPVQPFQFSGTGLLLRSAASEAAASSSAATISNGPIRITSPCDSMCGPASRACCPSTNVPLVL